MGNTPASDFPRVVMRNSSLRKVPECGSWGAIVGNIVLREKRPALSLNSPRMWLQVTVNGGHAVLL